MRTVVAKGICLFILWIDTVIFGWPVYFLFREGSTLSPRTIRIRAMVISYLNCFAGGVFMGACLIHMLAEGREQMEDYFKEIDYDNDFPIYEALAACGFFFIAGVEISAHKLLHKTETENEHEQLQEHRSKDSNGSRTPFTKNGRVGVDNPGYVATDGQGSGSLPLRDFKPIRSVSEAVDVVSKKAAEGGSREHLQAHQDVSGNQVTVYDGQRTSITSQHGYELEEPGQEIVAAIQTLESNPLRAFLLLAALSFHTVFDGLAVGLTHSDTDVWQMFIAIIIHKSLVAVCLASQLFLANRTKPFRAFFWIFFFSLIAPMGLGIGMYLTSGGKNDLAQQLIGWILQAIATGTFMYVTFFEILRDELMERGGFLRLLLVIIGFGGMALAKYFDKD